VRLGHLADLRWSGFERVRLAPAATGSPPRHRSRHLPHDVGHRETVATTWTVAAAGPGSSAIASSRPLASVNRDIPGIVPTLSGAVKRLAAASGPWL